MRDFMHKIYFNSSIKIVENIWQVGGGDLTGGGDASVYLICFKNMAALIDAGCGNGHEQLIENISGCLPDNVLLSHLLLTHCHYDHSGGAKAVRNQFGCKIVCHELDAVFLEMGDSEVTAASWYRSTLRPFSVDIKLEQQITRISFEDNEIIAYHCPGHSPGSVVYMVEKDEKKILFGQDIHGPLHPSLLSNRKDYMNSLKMIMDLNADILCEGHFGIFRGKNEVRRFISSYLEI
jgi:glyoxylase-like metal-dependent hydrolase (beta-lactamase superfamily II)